MHVQCTHCKKFVSSVKGLTEEERIQSMLGVLSIHIKTKHPEQHNEDMEVIKGIMPTIASLLLLDNLDFVTSSSTGRTTQELLDVMSENLISTLFLALNIETNEDNEDEEEIYNKEGVTEDKENEEGVTEDLAPSEQFGKPASFELVDVKAINEPVNNPTE